MTRIGSTAPASFRFRFGGAPASFATRPRLIALLLLSGPWAAA